MKILAFAIGALVFIGIGFFVASGPQPHIVIPGEHLWTVGPLDITSTLMGAWLTVIVLILFAFVATRSMNLIPSGIQNFTEAVIDFLFGQVEEIAGHEQARRFFPFVATLFLFILLGNWLALLPIYKTVGITVDEGQHVFHEIEHLAAEDDHFHESKEILFWDMTKSGPFELVSIGSGTMKFDLIEDEDPHDTLDRYVVTLAEYYTDFEDDTPEGEVPSAEAVQAAAAALEANPDDAPQLLLAETHAEGEGEESAQEQHGIESAALGATVEGIDFGDTHAAIVHPFFRAPFSDLNNTLALAILAFVFIEMWGFQVLGFSYLGKFFVAPWKSPIMTFVGFLELLSEFIRVISFSFRLFGNIFAGSVLLLILTFLVPFLAPTGILALELFVGFIQAAVFALLVIVFGMGAVASHHEDEHGDGHGHDDGHHIDTHATAGAAQAH